MKLIKADDLMADIEATIKNSGCVNHEGEIMDCIRYASEVDAVSVVRGEWINKEPPNADNNIYCICSNCSAGDLHAVDAVVPYCWKCGAKMDKGGQL